MSTVLIHNSKEVSEQIFNVKKITEDKGLKFIETEDGSTIVTNGVIIEGAESELTKAKKDLKLKEKTI